MLTSKLTTIDNIGFKSLTMVPENVRSLMERRTQNGKVFGKLDIFPPLIERDAGIMEPPRNIIAGFLLDTSGSMQGTKIEHAINTIKKLVEVLLSERNGKTIKHQPFHSWIYLITFNSKAELMVPFQEITDETVPQINKYLDNIYVSGCTNYEVAFQKQSEVLSEIIAKLESEAAVGHPPQHYHILRFFETDGDITEGSRNIQKLYKMMRNCTTATTTRRITFEDVILGYGTDVALGCLKTLASAHPESETVVATTPSISSAAAEYNCSSLVTIIKPEDIGWQVGEILFKMILRFGSKVQVSVRAADDDAIIELFEYQTHEWNSTTTFHSLVHGQKRSLYIQYTPLPASVAPTATINLKIQYDDQFSGNAYTYEMAYVIHLSDEEEHRRSNEERKRLRISTPDATVQLVATLILGMIQIEIFKQYREIEANRYNKDLIVSEAYKTLRMLRSIDFITNTSFPDIACQTANLMNDVKVIIGLTTIEDLKEQSIILHARRICSAEQDIFNTGAKVSRKYVEREEEQEEEATRVISAAAAAAAAAGGGDCEDAAAEHEYEEEEEEEACDDSFPSRIATITRNSSIDTPCITSNQRKTASCSSGSELRTLCVIMTLSKKKNEDVTAEQLYIQMKQRQRGRGYHQEHDDDEYHGADDTFSNTPMDDDYTQRRMGMMRQMSS